jgi:iron complex outermembrane receptor protein
MPNSIHRLKTLRFIPLAVAIVLFPVHTNAHRPHKNAGDLFNKSLEELMTIRVIGSTLQTQTLAEVPASVTVYTREQIRQMGITDLMTLLQFTVGTQVQRNSTAGLNKTASIRGLRSNASMNEILFLLDGQRLNEVWSDGAIRHVSHLDLSHVSRVEIIRGPGSAIYGSNAFSGVVNILTDMSAQINVRVGTTGYNYVSAQSTMLPTAGS